MSDQFEVFHHPNDYNLNFDIESKEDQLDEGWYYWWCDPGCLPDHVIGPFDSYEEAVKEALEELKEHEVEIPFNNDEDL